MTVWRSIIAIALFMFCITAYAADVLLQFDSPEQKDRYHALIDELRCMVCQNQNIADSNAPLAQDLRERTYAMIKKGDSDDQIIKFMTDRFGDFVLYRPPFNISTALLWLAPVLILSIVFITYWSYSRRRRKSTVELSEDQRMQAQRLIDG